MSSPPPRRSVRRNVGVLFATQVVTWSVSMVLVIALPRYLGSEALGQLRLVMSIWLIAGVFVGLGTHMLVTLEVARHQVRGASIVAPTVVARAASFVVVAAVVSAFVTIAGYTSSVATLVMIIGLTTLLTNLGGVAVAALQGFENFALPSIASIVEKTLSAGVILVALLLGAGVHVIAAIGAVTAGVHLIIVFRFLRRYVRIRYRTSPRQVAVTARRGLPYLFGAFAIVAYHEVDIVMLSLLVDDEQIGWYAVADRLTSTALFIPTIVMSALFPTFARVHQENPAEAKRMVERGFRSLILLSVPIGLGLATLSTPITLLLFGEEFRRSGPVLAVLSVVLVLMFQTFLIGNYAVASGREKLYYSLIFAGFLATVPLDLVLVPWTNRVWDNGAIGGALAYIVTESTILMVALIWVAPHVLSRATAVRLGKCGVGGAVMLAAIWPVRGVMPLVPIVVGAVVYTAAIAALRVLTEEEREGVRVILSRVRDRMRFSSSRASEGQGG
jgi:O-antigen/teichoic acid export membrane protein